MIVAPDPVAPVAAINLWYAVGSKDEQPGKTGFAHLFEHFMFQGSRHVAKAEHMGLIQGAGGFTNGTTNFDRTNYFARLPSNQLELGLWLEADRMGSLLDALSQQNLDTQRDIVKNEKRQSYDNQPYGTSYERLMSALFPEGHPYHHTPIGSMADLDAASLDDVQSFFRAYYAPNNAVLSIVGDVGTEEGFAAADRFFGRIPANEGVPPSPSPGGAHRRRGRRDRARRRAAGAGPRRLPRTGVRDGRARHARGRAAGAERRPLRSPDAPPAARGGERPGRRVPDDPARPGGVRGARLGDREERYRARSGAGRACSRSSRDWRRSRCSMRSWTARRR